MISCGFFHYDRPTRIPLLERAFLRAFVATVLSQPSWTWFKERRCAKRNNKPGPESLLFRLPCVITHLWILYVTKKQSSSEEQVPRLTISLTFSFSLIGVSPNEKSNSTDIRVHLAQRIYLGMCIHYMKIKYLSFHNTYFKDHE